MKENDTEEFTVAQVEQLALIKSVRSAVLATTSASGKPLSSYAPVYIDDDGKWYVYVSAMAKHYSHLRKSGRVSATLIEDESSSENLFARKRLTVDCQATLVERDSELWNHGISGLENRHGSTMEYLKDLTDFDLFQLAPDEGRLVLGFGRAYLIWGRKLEEIGYLGAGGHRSK